MLNKSRILPQLLLMNLFLGTLILFFFTSCGLINSVNYSMRYSQPGEKLHGRQYQTKNFPSSVAITIKNVEHPTFYKSWDYHFRIKPTVHGERYKLEAEETRKNTQTGVIEHYPNLSIMSGSAFGNFESIGFTPIGSFYFILGLGAGVYKLKDKESIDDQYFRFIKKAEISYIGFVAKHWYVNLSARLFDAKYITYSTALKIGYYFGDYN